MFDIGLLSRPPVQRLSLSEITLCAVSSTNVAATVRAMEICLSYAEFADAVLFTDTSHADLVRGNSPIRLVNVARLDSSMAYSAFMLQQLPDFIETNYCLVVQWDSHIIDPARWRPEFLEYDYIGASWPQFADGHVVGNGGFSLRSRRLLEACRQPGFKVHHPEDVAICRTNRNLLESIGIRFAPAALADAFAAERAGDPAQSFGYHGVFLMPEVLGVEQFWNIYRALDERGSMRPDFWALWRAVLAGESGATRAFRMLIDQVADTVR